MKIKKSSNSIYKVRRVVSRGLIFIFAVVVIVIFSGTVKKAFQQNTSSSSYPSPIPPPPHETYTSARLGISFTYLTEVGGRQKFFTREIGDTVYLYYNLDKQSFNQPFPGTDAQFLESIAPHSFFVEVLNKNPNMPINDAIKSKFLAGYDQNECFVNASSYRRSKANDAYQTAIIDFSHSRGQSVKELDESVEKCPRYVDSYNFIRYFMTDPKHPNKLLFISIGQGNIPSGVGGSWDNTIKVIQ